MDNNMATVIGKDVIESLTISMYDDCKFIYREYIQNSADQIDKAINEHLIKEGQGEIYIQIDSKSKTICIEDNATGIAQNQVLPILKNIAQSTKQRGVDKGFRGIGRLGGLAYCDRLVFETSFKGEPVKSILTWNATLLKKTINNRANKEHASDVIDLVTEYTSLPSDIDEHYFKVSLIGVTNAELLNVYEIKKYLSMVAPVPFQRKFIYCSKIYEELVADGIKIDEYKIVLNEEQIYKAYVTKIYDIEDKAPTDEIKDIKFFKEKDDDGNWLYWGWYGISSFKGILKKINTARGIRLRKANIQVGDEDTLVRLHREDRGNNYFIGEIHAFHRDLIPNARRDYFTENDTYGLFEKKLKSFFHSVLYKLYHYASDANSAAKKIEEYHNFQQEIIDKSERGFTDNKEKEEYRIKLENKRIEAQKAEIKIKKIAETADADLQSPINTFIEKAFANKNVVVDQSSNILVPSKTKFRTDSLSKLSKEQRKFLSDIFGIIKNVLPSDLAEELIKKIEENYK